MQHCIRLVVLLLFLASCAPSRFVKPLDKNQQAINLSLGGPIISTDDFTIPLPFLTATYGYGLDSTLTGFGSVNLTSALYGNVQVEAGVVKNITQQHGGFPGISITPEANLIYRPGTGAKLYPQVDINAYWDFNRHRNFVYIGLCNWFELSSKKASGIQQEKHWFPSPMLGQTFVRRKWNLIIEAKILAPNLKNNYNTVDYKTPLGNNGAFGIYIGYTRKF